MGVGRLHPNRNLHGDASCPQAYAPLKGTVGTIPRDSGIPCLSRSGARLGGGGEPCALRCACSLRIPWFLRRLEAAEFSCLPSLKARKWFHSSASGACHSQTMLSSTHFSTLLSWGRGWGGSSQAANGSGVQAQSPQKGNTPYQNHLCTSVHRP